MYSETRNPPQNFASGPRRPTRLARESFGPELGAASAPTPPRAGRLKPGATGRALARESLGLELGAGGACGSRWTRNLSRARALGCPRAREPQTTPRRDAGRRRAIALRQRDHSAKYNNNTIQYSAPRRGATAGDRPPQAGPSSRPLL